MNKNIRDRSEVPKLRTLAYELGSTFISGQKEDLSLRGAYLHMAADAGVSLGVVKLEY